ncbi:MULTISPECIES: alpha-ketoglutarate-dependent dioxygenase AlkB family protein [Pseudomonadati]|uniref:Alpha-ketoglutarate-dependent dioxygenase AlkB n=1 Tax=Shewanella aestuarii TaxID=1028752 RepID=A0ABT0L0R7_9GAMM|nr:alpha-ketoglutarate-dependent dioxygenase AlkB [Shewanella aestuarii]MCL1117214.1 alpha-ketoglutarate-dependent dioxygenase AlkB [Shewanella aestuarii]
MSYGRGLLLLLFKLPTKDLQLTMTLDLFDQCDPSVIVPPVTLHPNFLNQRQQQLLLNEVSYYPLTKIEIEVFGKKHTIPRTQAWFGDDGCDCKYSKTLINPLPWPPILTKLRQTLLNRCQLNFNAVLVNHYKDGNDCMGWHSDDEPEIVAGSSIASITIGACRDFVVRHKASQQKVTYAPCSGDLIIMAPSMQQTWQHALPKRLAVTKPRINFTFRLISPNFYRAKANY